MNDTAFAREGRRVLGVVGVIAAAALPQLALGQAGSPFDTGAVWERKD